MNCNRNAKAIQAKSRKHEVEQVAPAGFVVKSGSSGQEYRVILNGVASCSCPWGEHRKIGSPCGCSHTVAVYDFLSQQAGYKVSAWNSEEAAHRQHRQTVALGDGLTLTLRK